MSEALAGFADQLRWVDEAPGEGGAEWRPCLERFHASLVGPWGSACSLWAQIYFNTLLIPATFLIARGWREGLAPHALSATFCPKTGAPLRFALHGGRLEAPCDVELALVGLLDRHVETVVAGLAAAGGLSKRMLWEGAELALRWSAAEIAAQEPTAAARLSRVAQGSRPKSRVASAWAPRDGRTCATTADRKYCCLRYKLDGYSACAEICPRRKAL